MDKMRTLRSVTVLVLVASILVSQQADACGLSRDQALQMLRSIESSYPGVIRTYYQARNQNQQLQQQQTRPIVNPINSLTNPYNSLTNPVNSLTNPSLTSITT